MDEAQALQYINEIGWRGSRPGLERIQALLEKMGNPERTLKFVHVAGTNGKGSTCAMLSSILSEAGYRTGLFVSPHLVRFHERIQVNGVEISSRELVEVTEFVRQFAETMQDLPTQFELMTAVALEFFRRRACDIVVLEVGMGGLLDSTNVIPPPEVAVITAIGLDHTAELGDTLEKIAAAKAGILKRGSRAVLSGQEKPVEDVVSGVCGKLEIPLSIASSEKLQNRRLTLDGMCFSAPEYGELRMSLLGEHQISNAATVLAAVEALRECGWKISAQPVCAGLSKTVWPGRFEILRRDPVFIVDGGHNPQGIATTARTIRTLLPGRKLTFVTGAMADKDIDTMYGEIALLASRFLTVTPDNPRALGAQALAQRLHGRFGVECIPFEDVGQAVGEAIRLEGAQGAVCTVGSLYLVGAVRAYFQKD